MACVTGTNVVNDGLVFHFDLENGVKSFRGKPTTNLLAGTNLINWSGTGSRVADTTVLSEKYKGGTIWHLEDADGVDPNVSTDNYYMYNSYGPVSAGQQYTLSLDIKVLQKSNIPNGGATNAIWIWYAQTTEYVYITNLPLGEWTRVHVTCTAGATYNYLIPRIDYDSNIIEIANIQFESGSIATKYIDGIRLDTASIVDVSPTRSTITAANLTYSQDDTPTFDGTNDFLSTGTPNITSTSFTLNSWVKLYSLNRYNPIIGDYQYDWFGLYFDSSNNIVSMHRKGSGQDNRLSYATNSFINTGTWYHITSVFDINVGKSLFINGEQVATNTNIYDFTLAAPRGPQYIGRHARGAPGSPEYMNGEISQVKIYNKALTDAEVKQNFEATRTRYGI